jgi:hypothetical protein
MQNRIMGYHGSVVFRRNDKHCERTGAGPGQGADQDPI